MVRIEFHAINTSTERIETRATIDLDTVDATVSLIPADVMFWGNVDINIPARSRGQVKFFHRPWGGVRIYGLTSHTHRLGSMSRIVAATATATPRADAGGATGTAALDLTEVRELHRSLNWSDPPFTTFDPPLQLETGQGLYLECNYNNTTDAPVTFGESFNEEMCFMWAYYYPAPRGTQICAEGTGFRDGVACFPF
jgi:hypothetical protein